jgi:hypothetical protein
VGGKIKWPASNDKANSIALDSSGNVHLTGNTGTINYDKAGKEIWVKKCNYNAVAIDAS